MDKELNILGSAKLMAMTAIDMLYGDAAKARDIIKNFKPPMTIDEYLAYQKQCFRNELFDGNKEDIS